jgi:hypothetical protein
MATAPSSSPERICEQLIGRMYASHGPGLTEFLSAIPEDARASVALHCYGRVHLRELALAIAATCDRGALIEAAGRIMGDILFSQSRQPSTPVKQQSARGAPTVTVASAASASALHAAVRATPAEPEDDVEETEANGGVEETPEGNGVDGA